MDLRAWWAEREAAARAIGMQTFTRAALIAGATRRVGSVRSFCVKNVFLEGGTHATEIMIDELTLTVAERLKAAIEELDLTFITEVRTFTYAIDKAQVTIFTKQFPGPRMEGTYLP